MGETAKAEGLKGRAMVVAEVIEEKIEARLRFSPHGYSVVLFALLLARSLILSPCQFLFRTSLFWR